MKLIKWHLTKVRWKLIQLLAGNDQICMNVRLEKGEFRLEKGQKSLHVNVTISGEKRNFYAGNGHEFREACLNSTDNSTIYWDTPVIR